MKQPLSSLLWHTPGRAWGGAMRAAPFRQWVQAGAAFAFSVLLAAIILILWRGGWTPDTQAQRIELLGRAGLALVLLTMLCLLAITDLAINFRASRAGLEANVGSDDHSGAAPLDPPPPSKDA